MNMDHLPGKNDKKEKSRDKKSFWKRATIGVLGGLALSIPSKANPGIEDSLGSKKNIPEISNVKTTATNSLKAKIESKFDASTTKETENKNFNFIQLTPQQMEDWNKFVDFVEAQGFKGSPELDVKGQSLALDIFNKFKEENPNVSFNLSDPAFVASVQLEMQNFAEGARAFAKRKGDPNAENLMRGVSKIDNWAGSKTTQYKFAGARLDNYNNNNLVSSKDLGLVRGDMTSTKSGIEKKMTMGTDGKYYFKGKKVEIGSDGNYYYENRDGDLVMVM